MGVSPIFLDFLESIFYLAWNETPDVRFCIYTIDSF